MTSIKRALGIALLSGLVMACSVPGRAAQAPMTSPASGRPTTHGSGALIADATPGRGRPKLALAPGAALAGIAGQVGLAIATSADGSTPPLTAGRLQSGVAWSTSKVPLTIAAIEADPAGASTYEAASRAIAVSDNAAAQRLWEGLGAGARAADRVDRVLRSLGDRVSVVQADVVRPGYTAFGQTQWSLAAQTAFGAGLACSTTAGVVRVRRLMTRIAAEDRWGLSAWPGSAFKAGWGPGTDGRYLVRQFGILPQPGGWSVVAIAAIPASGAFSDGVADLDTMTAWLLRHRTRLPVFPCPAYRP